MSLHSKELAKELNTFLQKVIPLFKEDGEAYQYMINVLVSTYVEQDLGTSQEIVGRLVGHLIEHNLIELEEVDEDDFLAMQHIEVPPTEELN